MEHKKIGANMFQTMKWGYIELYTIFIPKESIMNMFRKNKKGFTLIELIIVIAILAILAAIAIPMFSGITESANNAVDKANASNIATAYNAFQALNPEGMPDHIAHDVVAQDPIITALDGAGLWPAGLDPDVAEQQALIDKAWAWLNFHDGICELLAELPSGS